MIKGKYPPCIGPRMQPRRQGDCGNRRRFEAANSQDLERAAGGKPGHAADGESVRQTRQTGLFDTLGHKE
jgi:hypothetical protein